MVVTPCLMQSMYSASALARVPARVRRRSMAHQVPSSTSRKLVGLLPSMARPRARAE